MVAWRCSTCGRFTKAGDIYYVYGPMPHGGPDREACIRCHPHRDQVLRQQEARNTEHQKTRRQGVYSGHRRIREHK